MRAASPVSPVANMAVKSAAAPSKAPSLASYQSSLKIPRNTKFKVGQFKGKTFWEILHRHPDYFPWTLKNAKSPGASECAEWVNKHFDYRGAEVYRRNSWEDPPPIPKGHTRMRKPPNPLKEKCANCTQFTHQGSTVYTIKGHAWRVVMQLPLEGIGHPSLHSRVVPMRILTPGVHLDLSIELTADSVALSWMRPRWSSNRFVGTFPRRF